MYVRFLVLIGIMLILFSFVSNSYASASQEKLTLIEHYQTRPRNEPYGNTHNMGWKNHLNLENKNPTYAQNHM